MVSQQIPIRFGFGVFTPTKQAASIGKRIKLKLALKTSTKIERESERGWEVRVRGLLLLGFRAQETSDIANMKEFNKRKSVVREENTPRFQRN